MNENLNIDLEAARKEFLNREGGVAHDAKLEEIEAWLKRALETLPYATETDREDAFMRWAFGRNYSLTLKSAEDFLKDERERFNNSEENGKPA